MQNVKLAAMALRSRVWYARVSASQSSRASANFWRPACDSGNHGSPSLHSATRRWFPDTTPTRRTGGSEPVKPRELSDDSGRGSVTEGGCQTTGVASYATTGCSQWRPFCARGPSYGARPRIGALSAEQAIQPTATPRRPCPGRATPCTRYLSL